MVCQPPLIFTDRRLPRLTNSRICLAGSGWLSGVAIGGGAWSDMASRSCVESAWRTDIFAHLDLVDVAGIGGSELANSTWPLQLALRERGQCHRLESMSKSGSPTLTFCPRQHGGGDRAGDGAMSDCWRRHRRCRSRHSDRCSTTSETERERSQRMTTSITNRLIRRFGDDGGDCAAGGGGDGGAAGQGRGSRGRTEWAVRLPANGVCGVDRARSAGQLLDGVKAGGCGGWDAAGGSLSCAGSRAEDGLG